MVFITLPRSVAESLSETMDGRIHLSLSCFFKAWKYYKSHEHKPGKYEGSFVWCYFCVRCSIYGEGVYWTILFISNNARTDIDTDRMGQHLSSLVKESFFFFLLLLNIFVSVMQRVFRKISYYAERGALFTLCFAQKLPWSQHLVFLFKTRKWKDSLGNWQSRHFRSPNIIIALVAPVTNFVERPFILCLTRSLINSTSALTFEK